MAITTPPTISALPDPPDPNSRATYNTHAYPWSIAQATLATEVGAVAANVYSNASQAETLVNGAMSAGLANAASNATTATTQAGIATTQAGIATDKAAEAAANAASVGFTASSVTTFTNKAMNGCTVDGVNGIGYNNIPQNSRSADYTLALGDAGKHILHPTADATQRDFTIPANASVAYPIGTAITFINQVSAGVMRILITSDTMRLAGAGTTGSRTLAANGVATAIKITATEWYISGTNLT